MPAKNFTQDETDDVIRHLFTDEQKEQFKENCKSLTKWIEDHAVTKITPEELLKLSLECPTPYNEG